MILSTMSTFRDLYLPKVNHNDAFDPSRLIVRYLTSKGQSIPLLYARGTTSSGYPEEAFEGMALDDMMKAELRQINNKLGEILLNERNPQGGDYEDNDAKFHAFLIGILHQVLRSKASWWNLAIQKVHLQVIITNHPTLRRSAARLRFNVENGHFEISDSGRNAIFVLRQPKFDSLCLKPHPEEVKHIAYIRIKAVLINQGGGDEDTDIYLRGMYVRNEVRMLEKEANVGFSLLDLFANYDWTRGGLQQGR